MAVPDFPVGAEPDAPQPRDQTVVLFGNSNPQMQVPVHAEDPETGALVQMGTRSVRAQHLEQSETRVEMWQGFDDPDAVAHSLSTDNERMLAMIGRSLPDEDKRYAVGLRELEDILGVHHAGTKPNWVCSNDAEFARVIGAHFDIPVADSPPELLLTNGGRDKLHDQHLTTGSQPAAFNYMGLANNATATAPGATDTTLTGEITTGGGGLIRAQATYAHTAGTNTSTLTKTFTANGSDSLPVTISQDGVFNASSSGTMAYKTALNANATLSTSGDSITVTHTLTAG